MSPEEAVVRRLRAEIEQELLRLARLREDAAGAPRTEDPYAIRARGSILHDVYSGIERIFERIADELDGGPPRGDQWHRQLLNSMTLQVPGVRPAIIAPELGAQLRDFLGFRHRFRHLDGYELYGERMALLEERVPEVITAFDVQIRVFLDWLTGPLQKVPASRLPSNRDDAELVGKLHDSLRDAGYPRHDLDASSSGSCSASSPRTPGSSSRETSCSTSWRKEPATRAAMPV